MKVALVHDWLNQKVGGAENVLFELSGMYPKADIYTLVYNKAKFDSYLQGRNIITSRLQKRPGFMKRNPALLLGGIQKAVLAWDFSSYDLIISSSSAWVKNIRVPKGTRHVCYCHTPARMIWDSWPGYLDTIKLGPFKLGRFGKLWIGKKVSKLRLWDYYSTKGVDTFVANSQYVAGRIEKYYHRDSEVVYPPVDVDSFKLKEEIRKNNYYLIVSVLAAYKQIDVAIKAFKKLNKRLIIVGDGPDTDRLKAVAGNSVNIEFLGRVNELEKIQKFQHARAFVFCSVEDFGITMVEALAANTAVIALRGGGAMEIIKLNQTGWFFENSTPDSLAAAILKFEKVKKPISSKNFVYVYHDFSVENFREGIKRVVKS